MTPYQSPPKPTSLRGLKRGWGADLSIHDRVITLTSEGEEKVEEFMQGFYERNQGNGIKKLPTWNSKNRLTDEQLEELDEFVEELKKEKIQKDGQEKYRYIADVQDSLGQTQVGIRDYPGGSTGNTIYNLGRILKMTGISDKEFSFKLLTVIGNGGKEFGQAVNQIRKEYTDAGIEPIVPEGSDSLENAHARSIVFINPKKEKLSLTHSGRAPELINAGLIKEEDIENADFIFLQSTALERFENKQKGEGERHEFFDKITKLRWKYHKPLIYALPTSSYRGRHEIDNERARLVIPAADYIVCNNEELINIFHEELKEKFVPDYETGKSDTFAADKVLDDMYEKFPPIRKEMEVYAQELLMQEIRKGMVKRDEEEEARKKDGQGNPDYKVIYPVVFITRGENGATVIDMSKARKTDVEPTHIPEKEVSSGSGAGDAAYSGFLAGQWLSTSPVESASLGMEFAAEKRTGGGPRLSEPSLKRIFSTIHDLMENITESLRALSMTSKQEPSAYFTE